MAINPVQPNIETHQTTYRDAKKTIKTTDLVHPLAAEGHLVHDNLLSIPKFWLKDIAYDMKAVRDGFNGTAKDHQTGRLNDVGLKLGGIGIASYLASQTSDPKMRVMEYVGLGSFLACMQLYPLIAINAPSRLIQGYDIGKEYIDDQGRKKSVFQDGNYIPYDMYRGEYAGEDLNIIGDRMGIPRGIKNRDELTKEQMRKIAIQNNTLWMLGAGFATPVMTALLCCGLEQVVSPALEIVRNKKYNRDITHILKETNNMTLNVEEIAPNALSEKVEKFLTAYKGKELPKAEFQKLVKLLSKETDDNLRCGIEEDLEKLLRSEKNAFVIGDNYNELISNAIKSSFDGRQRDKSIDKIFALSEDDINQALKRIGSDKKYINEEQIVDLKTVLKSIFEEKIAVSGGNKAYLRSQKNKVIENVVKALQSNPSSYVSERGIKDITDFAKVLGDFKAKDRVIDKCKSFKVEYAPETVLARSYKKFENAIFKALDIKYKDLIQMKDSEKSTKEILERKIQALVSDELKYKKTIEKLAKIMSETEVVLHGEDAEDSFIKDLITAYENNYNKTAKRINNIGEGKFSKTINKLIKEDVNGEIKSIVETRKDVFDLIDGVKKPFIPKGNSYGEKAIDTTKELSKRVGSSKELAISRIIDRMQGVLNSQRRLIHMLDIYKREVPKDEYGKHVNETIKKVLLEATSADHTLKLHTDNNPLFYKDIMSIGWDSSIEESTRKALETAGNLKKGSVAYRFKNYLRRFFDIMGQNDIDFKKPDHKIGRAIAEFYTAESNSRGQKFNLVAQNPIDYFKIASKTRFENQKWLRTASGIGAAVLGLTVLAQFGFGKIKNPHNIQRQVNDDKNN